MTHSDSNIAVFIEQNSATELTKEKKTAVQINTS
jgi:hypothetical protein